MSRPVLFFQSKVALAVIGAVLCGGGAAWVAAVPFTGTTNHAAPPQPQSFASIAAVGTATAIVGASPTPGKSPTATPTPRPPTPTPTTGSGLPTIRGAVASVDTNAGQFTINVSGGSTKTVIVNAQTSFHGGCTSLSGLQTGWRVSVQGTYQADGSFAASSVYSSSDN